MRGSAGRRGGRRAGAGGEIESRLGYPFRDPKLLRRALTHRSRARGGTAEERDDYERLEFLGDSLLGFLVADRLYGDDPGADEGVLTRRKQSVVRTEALAEVGRRLGLGEALLLGRGEEQGGGRTRPALLADAFEGVLGAVYLDGGIRAARSFVRRHLGPILDRARDRDSDSEDHKTRLQEEIQAVLHVTPFYRLVRTVGPPHRREFEAEVLLAGESIGSGRGASRKAAEQEAARDALVRLHGEGTGR